MRGGSHLGRRFAIAALAGALLALAQPAIAAAHGLVVNRADLPIPEWLFAWGASLVLIVSFVAMSLLWQNARLEEERWRAVRRSASRLVVNPLTEAAAGALGVFLLGLVVWAGLNGTEAPDRNFAVTFVFVTAWLGLVFASALLGDIFRALNPWRAVARIVAAIFRLVAGQPGRAPLRYPERLGRWPAVAGIAGFAILELVFGISGPSIVGITPETIAVATLIYTGITFTGMALFGIETWLNRGEAFSVYFGMFARLSPLEVRDGRLGLRRPLTGATSWATVPGSVALVLVSIGITAFDGAGEGALAEPINSTFDAFLDGGMSPTEAFRLTNTLWLAASIAIVSAVYWAGVRGMHTVRGSLATRELGRVFAHTFIPIALAYLVAHYFSLFFLAEQAQFGFLLSDPLGTGADIFGTAENGIDYGSLGAETVWYVQVGALVAGHVTALALAHDRAITVYGDAELATRSQYWMLALMVAFTSLGLFLLSQANA